MSRVPHEGPPAGITIRSELRPGDVGMITHLHGVHYAREHGLDHTFEPYVARPLSELVLAGPDAGRVWIAERGTAMLGSIAIVKADAAKTGDGNAQLRWFLVVPEARGLGLGARLVDLALDYCRAEGLLRVTLWTFDELAAALALYRARGFIVTERKTDQLWGRERTELKMELAL